MSRKRVVKAPGADKFRRLMVGVEVDSDTMDAIDTAALEIARDRGDGVKVSRADVCRVALNLYFGDDSEDVHNDS